MQSSIREQFKIKREKVIWKVLYHVTFGEVDSSHLGIDKVNFKEIGYTVENKLFWFMIVSLIEINYILLMLTILQGILKFIQESMGATVNQFFEKIHFRSAPRSTTIFW